MSLKYKFMSLHKPRTQPLVALKSTLSSQCFSAHFSTRSWLVCFVTINPDDRCWFTHSVMVFSVQVTCKFSHNFALCLGHFTEHDFGLLYPSRFRGGCFQLGLQLGLAALTDSFLTSPKRWNTERAVAMVMIIASSHTSSIWRQQNPVST